MEFWWNSIILLTGGVSLRYLSGFRMVSVDVREVIVAGWWRGWELCSELGSFGSTVSMRPVGCCAHHIPEHCHIGDLFSSMASSIWRFSIENSCDVCDHNSSSF
jgi:hypothetical protein